MIQHPMASSATLAEVHSPPASLALPRLLLVLAVIGVSVSIWPTTYPAPASTVAAGVGGTDGGS